MKNISNYFFVIIFLFFQYKTQAQRPLQADPVILSNAAMNQVGYETNGKKIILVPSLITGQFTLVNSQTNAVELTGDLSNVFNWSYANQNVRFADFSGFTTEGTYYLSFQHDSSRTNAFEIKPCVNYDLTKAAIKAYYYLRASSPILAQYGGKWSRAEGHPDTIVYVHSSAATTKRPVNTVIRTPGGWYDAGDYNKYIVNSGISTYTLLALYEHNTDYFKTIGLNIPESNNTIPDLLDEILWNVRWMLTMQDPFDGGVYHKCTTKDFCGFIMPNKDVAARYVVQKGTAATLDFAAVMAVSARIFKNFSTELPGLSDSCMNAAFAAWRWAKKNPNKAYNQPSDIKTGGYGDSNFSDELAWAGTELYISTRLDSFMVNNKILTSNANVPSWPTVNMLGVISLAQFRNEIYQKIDTNLVINKIISQADKLYSDYQSSAYQVSLTGFWWGSNSEIANESIILLQAFRLTGDDKYLEAARANLDYLLGKNPTGYCFVTGFGSKPPMDIHHRPSYADGIVDPIPGYLAGGPNPGNQSQDCGASAYPSTLPALSYLDSQCSYSTNEVAINWNAPLAYVAGTFAALGNCGNSSVSVHSTATSFKNELVIYPNPAIDRIFIDCPSNYSEQKIIELYDINGKKVLTQNMNQYSTTSVIDINTLNEGIYFIKVTGDHLNVSKKFIKKN